MISLSQFIQNTQGQSLLYPPNPGDIAGQCVQPAMFYIEQVWGQSPYWRSTASQYFTSPDGRFNYTANNPNDPNQIPPVGALIVWSSSLPGSGGSGHIGIFISNNGNHSFTSYDSNWGGKYCHYVAHDWQYVIGWITPKQRVVLAAATITNNETTGEEMINTDTQAHQVYKAVRPNGDANQDEINMTVGKRTYAQFFNDAQNEVNQRDANLRDLAQHSADLQNLINQQNATIAELTASGTKSKDDYDAAVSKIADLNAQLATKHDLISDIQAKLSAAVTPAAEPEEASNGTYGGTEQVSDTPKEKAPSWAVRVLMWVLSRRTKKS